MEKRIIIFGASGFIATYLIDELSLNGYKIYASDISNSGKSFFEKKNIPFFQIDITKEEEFEKLNDFDIDIVIHLAALQPANFSRSKYTAKDYIDINVLGTVNILEYCKRKQVKKIIYGCSHRNTSGLWKKNIPIEEKDGSALEYEGEYAMFSISENAAQDCIQFYQANYNIQGIIFRLPPVYGFGPHLEIYKNGKPIKTGFQTFIENAIEKKPIEVWGDTSVGRDIIYVKDVVAAFVKAIHNEDASGLFNISTGYKLTLQEEVETIVKVFCEHNTKPEMIMRPEKQHTMDSFVYSNKKAKEELDWSPKYNFEQLLLDYKKELDNNRFGFLIDKRKNMFDEK